VRDVSRALSGEGPWIYALALGAYYNTHTLSGGRRAAERNARSVQVPSALQEFNDDTTGAESSASNVRISYMRGAKNPQ
jgi:hypothetical protein